MTFFCENTNPTGIDTLPSVVCKFMQVSFHKIFTYNHYLQAFLLRLVISYLESDVTSLGYGLGLTAGVFACEITRACAFANLMIFGAQTGTRVIMRFSFL